MGGRSLGRGDDPIVDRVDQHRIGECATGIYAQKHGVGESHAEKLPFPLSLTELDVESYRRDGYLFPVRVFDGETIGHLLARVEALEQTGRTASNLRRPLIDYFRANLHIVSRFAADIAKTPAILDAVEAILGPDLMVWMTELIIKEPSSRKILSMHQDLTYWGMGGSQHEVTAWIALTS